MPKPWFFLWWIQSAQITCKDTQQQHSLILKHNSLHLKWKNIFRSSYIFLHPHQSSSTIRKDKYYYSKFERGALYSYHSEMEILSIFVAKEIFKLKWNEIVCELPSLVRWEGAAVIASACDSSHNNVFESYSGIKDDRKKKNYSTLYLIWFSYSIER